MNYQNTIKNKVSISGVGLHNGEKVTVTLKPADEYDGITFSRTDVSAGSGVINICANSVIETELCTKIGNEYKVTVSTIEHLMAALYAMEIDNVLIEIDGEEVPILDGSSLPWIELITKAETQQQLEPRKYLKILKEVVVKEGNCAVSVKPLNDFTLHIFIEYGIPIPPQKADFTADKISFISQLAKARTFCLEKDVEYMQSMGLIKGGNLDNAIVVNNAGIVNEGGESSLRFKDEFIRHKALDAVGDFYMSGYRILGAFSLTRPGHELNNRLLRAILENPENWQFSN